MGSNGLHIRIILLLLVFIFFTGAAFSKLIYKIDGTKNIVLTFDDGPKAGVTEKVLDILKQEKVKAVFFLTGKRAEERPELTKRIFDEGHEIGNHTFSHARLASLSDEALLKEIDRTSKLIEGITGKRPRWFRPPYGKIKTEQIKFIEKAGYKIVLWTVGAADYMQQSGKKRNAGEIKKSMLYRTKGGNIIMLHADNPETAQALPEILKGLKAKGFKFVRL